MTNQPGQKISLTCHQYNQLLELCESEIASVLVQKLFGILLTPMQLLYY